MRKEYRQALRDMWSKAMRERLPQFTPSKERSPYVWPGEMLHLWQARPGLRVYVIMSPDLKAQQDAFSVSLAWSRLDRFPHLSMRPSSEVPSAERLEFDRDEFEVSLAELCEPARQWWSLWPGPATPLEVFESHLSRSLKPVSAAEAREAIGPLVTDAMACLGEHGLPYIEALVNHGQ
jgi:hypothetical protein